MTKEGAAKILDGLKAGEEIDDRMKELMRGAGLVAAYCIFGEVSDRDINFFGAISATIGYGSSALGKVADIVYNRCDNLGCPYFGDRIGSHVSAEWQPGMYWLIESDAPNSTFGVFYENGSLFCRGIVFNLADVQSVPSNREMVFTAKTFGYKPPAVKFFKAKRRIKHVDYPWENLLYLAGVAPEDMPDVLKVFVQLGEMKVEMKPVKPIPADMHGDETKTYGLEAPWKPIA